MRNALKKTADTLQAKQGMSPTYPVCKEQHTGRDLMAKGSYFVSCRWKVSWCLSFWTKMYKKSWQNPWKMWMLLEAQEDLIWLIGSPTGSNGPRSNVAVTTCQFHLTPMGARFLSQLTIRSGLCNWPSMNYRLYCVGSPPFCHSCSMAPSIRTWPNCFKSSQHRWRD